MAWLTMAPCLDHLFIIIKADRKTVVVVKEPLGNHQWFTSTSFMGQGVSALDILAQNEPYAILADRGWLVLVSVYISRVAIFKK